MALKDEVPTFVKGSPDLGAQLRDLAAVVFKICEAIEADEAAAAGAESAPEAPAEPEAPAAPKTTSRAATKAAAK